MITSDERVRELVQHTVSGEHYIVEYRVLWDQNVECCGHTIIAANGPIYYGDLDETVSLLDWELDSEDADWLNAEEQAGRLQ